MKTAKQHRLEQRIENVNLLALVGIFAGAFTQTIILVGVSAIVLLLGLAACLYLDTRP